MPLPKGRFVRDSKGNKFDTDSKDEHLVAGNAAVVAFQNETSSDAVVVLMPVVGGTANDDVRLDDPILGTEYGTDLGGGYQAFVVPARTVTPPRPGAVLLLTRTGAPTGGAPQMRTFRVFFMDGTNPIGKGLPQPSAGQTTGSTGSTLTALSAAAQDPEIIINP
jgi:hypothetical protein